MALLGNKGYLKLLRKAPEPVVIEASKVNENLNVVYFNTSDYWSGDRVSVRSSNNWPALLNNTPVPFLAGETNAEPGAPLQNTSCLYGDGEKIQYYQNGQFYYLNPDELSSAPAEPFFIQELFIHVDMMNRVSFYSTRAQALEGALDNRINLVADDIAGASIVLKEEWAVEARIESWEINLEANEVDTTGLGDQFYDGVKSLVRGGGSFDFLVDRTREADPLTDSAVFLPYDNAAVRTVEADYATTRLYSEPQIITSDSATTGDYDNASIDPISAVTAEPGRPPEIGTTNLLRMLLIINKRGDAEAEFWIVNNRNIDTCENSQTSYTPLRGDLFYRATINIVNSAVNVQSQELIKGSARFVTVKEIRLLEGGT